MRDGQLRFRYASVQRELRETEQLARRFLHREAIRRLSEAADRLETLRHSSGSHQWGLPADAPLLTVPSDRYERGDRRGSHRIQAAIDSTWGITTENRRTFRVSGNVSTRVRLLDGENGPELGRWRVELGVDGAPGCFFHTQIRGQSEDHEPPWPHSVPVPRLPTPFTSIATVVVFVLGELFQTDWDRHVNHQRADRLAADQRRELERRLRWELAVIERRGTLPWSALKKALPHRDLLLPDTDPEALTGG